MDKGRLAVVDDCCCLFQVVYRIARKYPDFVGAVVTVNKEGEFGASCHGIKEFPFSVANTETGGTQLLTVPCIDLDQK